MPRNSKQNRTHRSHSVTGTLDIAKNGMGYVIVSKEEADIIIRPNDFNRAFNGDKVLVEITREGKKSNRREGIIVDVVSRKQTEFIGTLRNQNNRWYFIPDTDKPLPSFDIVEAPAEPIDEHTKVLVQMVEWNKKDKRPKAEFIKVLDKYNLGEAAMQDILLGNGFSLHFSDEVMEEALRISDAITPEELKKRKDFRDTLTLTIDPVDAKDFDDAISLKKINKDLFEIGIHIADVSHFVTPGTALDKEAYERATSVYLPDRVNPMLPERISNELCSLRPHEDKYTFSAVFEIDRQAQVKKYWLGRTLIHSNHRFAYEEVQDIIEGADGPYKAEILLLNDISQKLRKERFDKGAINFSSEEVRFKLDEHGTPIEVVVKVSKEANKLIEELMLLANRTVATHVAAITVKDKPLPFPYRIHDQPDEAKLSPFIAFAARMGHSFDTSTPEAIANSFNSMLLAVKGTPQQHVLETLGIRTMAKAIYTTENIGHYGLGFDNYCHFTSPIRRYPDVMVHRILNEVLNGITIVHKKLEEQCQHSSERERAAMDSERAGNKYKQVEYMSKFIGDSFDAVVTGVSTFGFWAETVAHKCEGLVSLRDLSEFDEFMYDEADYCLIGRNTGQRFKIGDPIKITVVSANLDKRQLDYEWVNGEAKVAPAPKAKTIFKAGAETKKTARKPTKKHVNNKPTKAEGKTAKPITDKAPIPRNLWKK